MRELIKREIDCRICQRRCGEDVGEDLFIFSLHFSYIKSIIESTKAHSIYVELCPRNFDPSYITHPPLKNATHTSILKSWNCYILL